MKKLEKKVFYVLTLIFTMFLVTILFIYNVQNYSIERSNIENNLMKMGNVPKEIKRDKNFPIDRENMNPPDENINRKIFMDYVLYTVKFDTDGNITEIITHTENGIAKEEIETIALALIKNENKKLLNIGNLYIDKYSYSFKENNQLVILDNEQANKRLKQELLTSIILLCVLEIVILYISKRLTKWIIKPANEAMEKQKQFIADASHELKTPVAVIMASAEALENDYEKKWINNIKNESERMSDLITNLLDLSKIENNDDKELHVMTNISKIIENSCLTFESLMFEKNIKFISNIEENIFIKCNVQQIKQLVAIVIDNAIKHSEQNGEIIVNLRKQKNETVLEIKNKGKEIPKEIKEKIFERFYRVDESRNRNENRYGLGLAIAKSIVQNHNGEITANSENGYTTFKINIK